MCRAGVADADLELLQLELRATREEAASAKGHMKQFQELAVNAERTIKDMEVGQLPVPRVSCPHSPSKEL